jgi:hypothetical protein
VRRRTVQGGSGRYKGDLRPSILPLSRSYAIPNPAKPARPIVALLLGGLALIAMLALTLQLGIVARQAVQQGDARQSARDLQSEAAWRCRALRPPDQRLRCLDLVRARHPSDSAAVQALVLESASSP